MSLDTPQTTHHAQFDFDPTTWVVWSNSQLVCHCFGCLFFLFFLLARWYCI